MSVLAKPPEQITAANSKVLREIESRLMQYYIETFFYIYPSNRLPTNLAN